jgi:hypothetical protein
VLNVGKEWAAAEDRNVGTDTVHGTEKGEAYSVTYRCTVTYLYRDGRWIALAEHLMKVPEPR